MNEKKSLLIISYYFPPNPIVGSRRWAKYGKVLQKNGVDVFVIVAETDSEKSPWDKDVEDLNVTYIPSHYPKILDDWSNKNLMQKIKYKVTDKWVKTKVKGMPYDRSVFWENELLKSARTCIERNNIRNVLVSTPPHRSAYYMTKLKKEMPTLNFMVDFRDPWMWGTFREYPNLSPGKKAKEEAMETEVINQADKIIVPVENMIDNIASHNEASKDKLYWLPPGFDEDDFIDVKVQKASNGPIKLIYYGSLYDNLDDHFNALAKGIKLAKQDVELDIYSNSKAYQAVFEQHQVQEKVTYHKPIPSKDVLQKVAASNYVLLFKPYEYGKDNVSTKYYEIIRSRTPVILIGEAGKASEFIVFNQLGIYCPIAKTAHLVSNLLNGDITIEYNEVFDVNPYSFQALGNQLINDLL